MTERAARKGLSFGALMAGAGVVSALALAAVVFAYFRFLRYEHVALRHLPDDCALAARLDVQQGAVYEPVREHWMPLVDAIEPRDETRMRRIEETVGLRRSDLREIVVGATSTAQWTLILGGLFPKDAVVERLAALLSEEGAHWALSKDRSVLIQAATGVAIGQAPDGVVLVASSEERLLRARKGGYEHPDLEYSTGQVASFALEADAIDQWARRLPPELATAIDGANRVRRIVGTVRVGDPMLVDVALFPDRGGAVGDARAWASRVLGAAREWLDHKGAADLAGERAILDRVTLSTQAGTAVISFTWQLHEVDGAAANVAETLLAKVNPPH